MSQNASGYFSSSQFTKVLRWIALVGWVLIVLANLFLYGLDLASDYADMLVPCEGMLGDGGPCNFLAVSAAEEAVLASWGLTLHFYATAMNVAAVILLLVYGVLSVLILWRQGASWLGLTVSLALIALPVAIVSGADGWSDTSSVLYFLVIAVEIAGIATMVIFLYLMPNGRFSPTWAYIPMIGTLLLMGVLGLKEHGLLPVSTQALAWLEPMIAGLAFFGGSLQIYRYARDSNPVERQRTKWIIFGVLSIVVAVIAWILIFSSVVAIPAGRPRLLANLGGWYFINAFCLLILPVAITIAIQRYKLWNVDVIINRALVYGSLTALLALIYFGSIIVLQRLFTTATGQQSDLAIVISTLVIAVLFNPLRLRLQRGIDRRFFRQRYDAEQALQDFALTARSEADLERLSAAVTQVVEETVQPASVSIWLQTSESGQ